jgi:hypothetical protein
MYYPNSYFALAYSRAVFAQVGNLSGARFIIQRRPNRAKYYDLDNGLYAMYVADMNDSGVSRVGYIIHDNKIHEEYKKFPNLVALYDIEFALRVEDKRTTEDGRIGYTREIQRESVKPRDSERAWAKNTAWTPRKKFVSSYAL